MVIFFIHLKGMEYSAQLTVKVEGDQVLEEKIFKEVAVATKNEDSDHEEEGTVCTVYQ